MNKESLNTNSVDFIGTLDPNNSLRLKFLLKNSIFKDRQLLIMPAFFEYVSF